jgi:hypothetical protein
MYAITKFGDVPAHLDHEMSYDRVVGSLRQDHLIDERLAGRYSGRYSGYFVTALFIVLTMGLLDVLLTWLWPVVTHSAAVFRDTPYGSIALYWSGYFVLLLFAHYTNSPDRSRLVWLYNLGTPVKGTLDIVRMDPSERALYDFGYHFVGPDGIRRKGRMYVFDRDLSPADRAFFLDDATECTVLYHPECPALSVIRLDNGVKRFSIRKEPLPELARPAAPPPAAKAA